ncbi:MAG: DUF1385 domain-containing protein [Hespellia sp.]|nr:DUF1385 domain-containing protein [Hespellia sp.]
MKSSNIGGQAVLEGIMMKNKTSYAVAVRKPDQTIEVKTDTYKSIAPIAALTKIPFVRGGFNFIDSMVLGMSTLSYSASFYDDEEESEDTKEQMSEQEQQKAKKKQERTEGLIMGGTILFSLVMVIALFTVLPSFIAKFAIDKGIVHGYTGRAVIEGVMKVLIFVTYILLISRMKDIQRVFMYHGAEHKCINCIEHGLPLTVENVRMSSRQHKRCGTSFLLFVVIISILVGMLIHIDILWLRIIVRIALFPVIAGISYEIIKLAGCSENPVISLLSKPGLWTQKLTTKEPEDDMIEVAITAVEAVFDWEAFEETL